MSSRDQERLVAAMKIVQLHKKYEEIYGKKDWKKVYEEDKANGTLMVVD